VPECDAQSSKQVFEATLDNPKSSRTKRECVICRFEGRKLVITTVHCKTHQVSLCMRSYDDVPSDLTQTCWQKFHDFYLPQGLFNSNGNIRRACPLYKARKGLDPGVEEEPRGSFVQLLHNAQIEESKEDENEVEYDNEVNHDANDEDIEETKNDSDEEPEIGGGDGAGYGDEVNHDANDEDIEETKDDSDEEPETHFVPIMSFDSNQSYHPSEDFDSRPLGHSEEERYNEEEIEETKEQEGEE
jgi:hypothetical protein